MSESYKDNHPIDEQFQAQFENLDIGGYQEGAWLGLESQLNAAAATATSTAGAAAGKSASTLFGIGKTLFLSSVVTVTASITVASVLFVTLFSENASQSENEINSIVTLAQDSASKSSLSHSTQTTTLSIEGTPIESDRWVFKQLLLPNKTEVDFATINTKAAHWRSPEVSNRMSANAGVELSTAPYRSNSLAWNTVHYQPTVHSKIQQQRIAPQITQPGGATEGEILSNNPTLIAAANKESTHIQQKNKANSRVNIGAPPSQLPPEKTIASASSASTPSAPLAPAVASLTPTANPQSAALAAIISAEDLTTASELPISMVPLGSPSISSAHFEANTLDNRSVHFKPNGFINRFYLQGGARLGKGLSNQSGQKGSSSWSYSAGLGYQQPISSKFSLLFEVAYLQRNGHSILDSVKQGTFYLNQKSETSYANLHSLEFLHVPLLLHYTLHARHSIQFGPYASIVLNSTSDLSRKTDNDLRSVTQDLGQHKGYRNGIAPVLYGASIGYEYNLIESLTLGCRFGAGMNEFVQSPLALPANRQIWDLRFIARIHPF